MQPKFVLFVTLKYLNHDLLQRYKSIQNAFFFFLFVNAEIITIKSKSYFPTHEDV